MSGMREQTDRPKWMQLLSCLWVQRMRQTLSEKEAVQGVESQKGYDFCSAMKTLMKPVRMLAWASRDGIVTPIRFLWNDGKCTRSIRVSHIVARYEDKFAGNRMLGYRCQEWIDGEEKVFELKFEVKTCIWYLYKI